MLTLGIRTFVEGLLGSRYIGEERLFVKVDDLLRLKSQDAGHVSEPICSKLRLAIFHFTVGFDGDA